MITHAHIAEAEEDREPYKDVCIAIRSPVPFPPPVPPPQPALVPPPPPPLLLLVPPTVMFVKYTLAGLLLGVAVVVAMSAGNDDADDVTGLKHAHSKRKGWGKRASEAADYVEMDKRRGWGKRSMTDFLEEDELTGEMAKRGWGKRYFDLEEMTKRGWGKRSSSSSSSSASAASSPSSSASSYDDDMAISKRRGWGKRSSLRITNCDRLKEMMLYHINRAVQVTH